MIVEWALNFALLAVGAALLLCAWRLLRGPELPDRVLALDTMYVNIVALVVLLGLRQGTAAVLRGGAADRAARFRGHGGAGALPERAATSSSERAAMDFDTAALGLAGC